MSEKKIWLGETTCDFYHEECEDTLYDAKTLYGPWATMCEDCFRKHGYGALGPGMGQGYMKNSEGEFEKFIG